jgi:hypothetical protein
MRVAGVSPANAHRSELRRSEPPVRQDGFGEPFRFSDIDVILDLSADAAARTGHDVSLATRRRRVPPDAYTEFGTLAYPDYRETIETPLLPDPIRLDAGAGDNSPPKVTVVTFDGKLRLREAARTVPENA